MQVKGLPENLTCYQIINDIWNDKYQPCKADNEIKNLLNCIQKFDLQVTEVVHERSIRAKVFFRKNYEMSKDEFTDCVSKIYEMFGFFKLSITDFIQNNSSSNIDDFSYFDIHLIGTLTGLAFSSTINEIFTDIKYQETKLQSNQLTNKSNSKCAKNIIRQDFTMNYYDYNEKNKTNITIFSSSHDASKKELEQCDINKNLMCLYICDEPKTYLPQFLHVNNIFPFIENHVICRECIIETFKSMNDLQNVINPQTNMIDRKKN